MTIDPKDKKSTTQDGVDDEVLTEKLIDAEVPGFEATFDPDEAERLGIFEEDALSEDEAKESSMDDRSVNHEK